jgi:hypothetical protein
MQCHLGRPSSSFREGGRWQLALHGEDWICNSNKEYSCHNLWCILKCNVDDTLYR